MDGQRKMGISHQLAAFCQGIRYEDLPKEVIDKCKYLTLDFLGVASRGSIVDSTKVMYELVKDLGLDSKGGKIIGTDMRASYQYAALANGTSAHSLEMDDVVNEASLHPAVAILPAALAASEMVEANGKKFIEGVVVGYETMVRLGKALNPSAHYAQGFHPTGTCGAFGAVVAASKIIGLDVGQMLNAMGIVGSQAAGSMEFLADGAWTKRMHPGWAAHSGIIATLLAQKGFRGPSAILEGRDGFLHAYSPLSDVDIILEGLGETYQIIKTSIKPHACCRYKQAPIDGILSIIEQNHLKEDEIEKVTLGILKTGFPIIVKPEELKYNPKSVVDAQFSMPFGAAVAIIYGKATLDEYIQQNVDSERVKEMMKKVICVEDPEIEKEFPRKWPASATILTKNGKEYSARIDYPKGDPENPLTWDELINKFKELTTPLFPFDRMNEIIDRTQALEKEGNLKSFSSLLSTHGLTDH